MRLENDWVCKACQQGYVRTAAGLTFPCLVCRGRFVKNTVEKERDGKHESKEQVVRVG